MKRFFTVLAAVLLMASVFAQTPEKMSYQAVIRNSSDQLVTNQQVGIQISILQGSASGTEVYVETQTPTTNANGLVSIEIGAGTVQSGNFTTIGWANGSFFIKTETDPTGGANYTITGTSQILSVPYALHAKTAETATISGNETVFDSWDKIHEDDVLLTGEQYIRGRKIFQDSIWATGIGLPYSFGPDINYVGDKGAYIGFGHVGFSEDFIGYKNNKFYFKDSPGGGDETDPDIIVGGKMGIGIEEPTEKLEVDGNIDIHNHTIKNLSNPVNDQDAATKGYVDANSTITEIDPVYTSSEAANITETDITNLGNLSGSNTGDQDGSETIVTAGTNISVTGSGTTASPYVVNATGATTLAIGESYGGGIIFYLDASGQHGLIAATADQSTGIQWYNGSYTATTAFASSVGGGWGNTVMIAFNQGLGTYAANLCYGLNIGGNSDWYLPSKYELYLMYMNIGQGNLLGLGNVGGFVNSSYWSSTEFHSVYVWTLNYDNGFQAYYSKPNTFYVRAVRAF